MMGKRKMIAWGITGSGDRLVETLDVMKKINQGYRGEVTIQVYLSKAGNQVVERYHLTDDLKEHFSRIRVETNSNVPFLAGALQLGRFAFLLIAPATSNTVAKISLGIADTLLSNAASMALKAFIPVYIMPSDYREGIVITQLPDGRDLRLRMRKEDVEHVNKLANMEDVYIVEKPSDLPRLFHTHFG